MLLKMGSKGAPVAVLQRELKSLGYNIGKAGADGHFGRDTHKAVVNFQKERGLVPDGKVGSKTNKALQGGSCDNMLRGDSLTKAAKRLGVDTATVFAINEVETRGSGFFAVGKPAILYERHIMRRRLKANGQKHTGLSPDLVNSSSGGYLGGLGEYRRLNAAMEIHEQSALESCSWGAFQIMGYHWLFLGYDSIYDFTERMKESEDEHFEALVRFIEKQPHLHNALKAKDWATFSAGYNGRDYWRDGYHHKLAAAYEQYSRCDEVA